MRFSRVGLLGLLLLSLASFTWSQTGTSTIRGTITDPQGRVVANADVTLTNTGTNAARTTKSTDAGVYCVRPHAPGDYRLKLRPRIQKAVDRGSSSSHWQTDRSIHTDGSGHDGRSSRGNSLIARGSGQYPGRHAWATTSSTNRSRSCRWKPATLLTFSACSRVQPAKVTLRGRAPISRTSRWMAWTSITRRPATQRFRETPMA